MKASSKHPDQIYVQALLDNDRKRIEEIYAQHAPQIKRYILKNSGNEADAADIFSEGLMAIVRKARKDGLQLSCPFGAYLLMVCRSLWLNELKKRKRKGKSVPIEDLSIADENALADAEDVAIYQTRRKLFLAYFSKLGESCQQILRLSLEGEGMQEIAQKLEFSYAYARKRKSQCMAKLIKLIKASPEYGALNE